MFFDVLCLRFLYLVTRCPGETVDVSYPCEGFIFYFPFDPSVLTLFLVCAHCGLFFFFFNVLDCSSFSFSLLFLMGNQNVKENSEIFRKNVVKTKKGDECLINFGEKTLLKLEKTIFETYPFLSQDMEDSACLVDLRLPDQPLIYVNEQFSKLTLYPKEEIIGRNCRFLQGKFTNRKTVKRIQEAISAGEALDVELLNYRKDGLPFFNNFLLLPVWVALSMRDKGKAPTHYIAVQKDVTLVKPQLGGLFLFFFFFFLCLFFFLFSFPLFVVANESLKSGLSETIGG